jgi:flagellar secretion chaperone FliS
MSDDIRFAYRENTTRRSTPVGRVVLLYEQLIQDVGRAISAMRNQKIEDRTHAINHAFLVLGILQGSLDLERGGEVARNLDRFYGLMRSRLIDAQVQVSDSILEDQRALLLSLRAAWIEVEKVEDQSSVSSAPQPTTPPEAADDSVRKNWSA